MNGYITTYTGRKFYFEATPEEMLHHEMLCIEDIGHALSMICHFAGHTATFFSVAQHSILVARACELQTPEVSLDLVRWGLLHDAAEAYIGDMTRPLKMLLPDYKILEKKIMTGIAYKFGLPLPEPPDLKPIDDSILKLESKLLMSGAALHDGFGTTYEIADAPPTIPVFFISPMTHIQARMEFAKEFRRLFDD